MTDSKKTFTGTAVCSVLKKNAEHKSGMRGAYCPFVLRADDLIQAVKAITVELEEIGLSLHSFECLDDTNYLDRMLTDYEETLISHLDEYPVQYQDVHYFPADA